MNVVFRTDASSQIGTGHFMRCLALAEELKNQGAEISFLSRNLPTHLADLLTREGLKLISLSLDSKPDQMDELAHSSWLGISQSKDSQESKAALSDKLWDWLIVDHYALDKRWESSMRKVVKNIMVIDDLADRNHDCDVLLDQNYYRDMQSRYKGKLNNNCITFLGPKYALVRKEFRELNKKLICRNKQIKKILIFFGGVDSHNMTLKAIDALISLRSINFYVEVIVVIGDSHSHKDHIKKVCEIYNFSCFVQTDRMADLMMDSDLLIGAGGVSIIERMIAGLPSISVACAMNQQIPLHALASRGVTLYLGYYEHVTVSSLANAVLSASDRYSELSERVGLLCKEFSLDQMQGLLKSLMKKSN